MTFEWRADTLQVLLRAESQLWGLCKNTGERWLCLIRSGGRSIDDVVINTVQWLILLHILAHAFESLSVSNI